MPAPDDPTRPLVGVRLPHDRDKTGETVGRYVLLRRIGRGGGGQVFAAFDTVLDRNVALKELWDHGGSNEDIVREGRLLARLSHPSVVTLHDIAFGERDEVYLAMELVDGEDFATWAGRTDDIAAKMNVLRDAGAGIAAAHRSDVVHGDVKPSNILVDTEGRARVTDFGVARLVESNQRRMSLEEGPEDAAPPLPAAGTPAYMAPEQHAGRNADQRSDQYSFCLTAWEALAGAYPFELGDEERDVAATFSGGQEATGPLLHPLERLADQKRSWRPPSTVRNLPLRWVRALRRGLSPEPKDRWPSMDALLGALGRPRRRRWPIVVGGVALLGVAAAGWAWALRLGERCTGAPAALGTAWNMTTRAELEAAILGTGVGYAPALWSSLSEEIDGYASAWMDAYTDACEATNVRKEQSEELLDLRMACLQRARADLAAATGVLGELDGTSLQQAHRVVAGLPRLERCGDIASLQGGQAPPSTAEAGAVAEAREAIATSKALRRAGRIPDAKAVIDAASEAALQLSYEPVHVEVLVERGILEEKSGEYEPAKASFAEAVKLATKLGMGERALRAQRGLLYVVTTRLHDAKEGRAYLHVVEGLVERLGNRAEDRAELAEDRALLAFEEADFDKAVTLEREAVALFEEALGEHATAPTYARRKLAGTLRNMGRYEEAGDEYRALIERMQEWLGPDHTEVLLTRCDLAQVLFRQGDYEAAEAELRAALPPQEAILGRSHPEMLMYRATLAEILSAMDRNDEAEQEYRDALRNMGDGPGPEPELRNGLGNLLERTDRLDEAAEQLRRAAEVFTETLGPQHPNVAITRHNLANILARQGDYEAAEHEHRAALEALEASLGAEHPQVGLLRINLARMYKNIQRSDDARKELETGLEILRTGLGPDHPQTKEAEDVLARLEEEARR